MAARTPHQRLTPFYEEMRERTMDRDGVHIVYPLGRDFGIAYPGYFEGYQNFTARWFGYIVYKSKIEWGLLSGGGYAVLKFSDEDTVTAVVQDNDGNKYFPTGTSKYYPGDPFSFGVRSKYNRRLDRSTLEPMENEYVHYNAILTFNALKAHEYFSSNGSHVILSVHFGSDDRAVFPVSKGLDSVISGVVVMQPGSYAVYTGVYTGPDVIRVNAPGAVSDLGKPDVSGVYVKIGVRKNLKMYVFFPDYGKKAVMAPFGELVSTGHQFVPRFSMNFNVRHVFMESYC
ncbi:uncharacterized protein [Dermacentor albipictus]|uniref:uncharacterized protein isoform X2 n=1 Tax=Dermacentor albipictus TaxID=60249 RepID=UPI0031FC091D